MMASIGAWSILASYMPFSRWMAPGPTVPAHSPSLSVSFAWALAAKAPASSCRTPIHSNRLSSRSAAESGLMASPKTPHICRLLQFGEQVEQFLADVVLGHGSHPRLLAEMLPRGKLVCRRGYGSTCFPELHQEGLHAGDAFRLGIHKLVVSPGSEARSYSWPVGPEGSGFGRLGEVNPPEPMASINFHCLTRMASRPSPDWWMMASRELDQSSPRRMGPMSRLSSPRRIPTRHHRPGRRWRTDP